MTRKDPIISLLSRLNKPNQALVIKPEKGKLAGNGLKLHLALLFKSQQQMLMNGQGIPDSDFMFEAAVVDLIDLINVSDTSDIRQSLKGYFVDMMSTVVRWESPDVIKSSTVIWAGMPMLSFAELELRNGKLWARWQLPGPLLRAVADPTLYTPIDLLAVSRLSSYAAVALYQICVRYRHNPSGVTSKNTPDWWLDALISTPAIDPKTKKRVVREWRKKKNAIVIDAILDINSKTDIEVELLEFREGEGKNVTGVQFAVKQKIIQHAASVVAVDLDIVRLCTKIGLSQSVVDSHMKSYSIDQIKQALITLEARMGREDLDSINKPATYLSKLLRDVAEKPNVQGGAVSTLNSQVRVDLAPPKALNEPVALLRSAITAVKEEVLGLDIEVRKMYAERAFASFKEKGLVTATMSRNLVQGNWSGALLAKMVEIYAEERYGENWQSLSLLCSNGDYSSQ